MLHNCIKSKFLAIVFLLSFSTLSFASLSVDTTLSPSTVELNQTSPLNYSLVAASSIADDANITWKVKEVTTMPSWLKFVATPTAMGATDSANHAAETFSKVLFADDGTMYSLGILAYSTTNISKLYKKTTDGTLSTLIDVDANITFAISMAFDTTKSNLYITDVGAGAIKKYNLDTNETTTILDGLDTPSDVVVGSDDTIYVSCTGILDGNKSVVKRTTNGEVSILLGDAYFTNNLSPTGLALDAENNLFIAVRELNITDYSTYTSTDPAFGYTVMFLLGNSENNQNLSRSAVIKQTPQGVISTFFDSSLISTPIDIEIHNSYLYVAGVTAGKKIDMSSKEIVQTYFTPANSPLGGDGDGGGGYAPTTGIISFAFDANENLYLSTLTGTSILKYSDNGLTQAISNRTNEFASLSGTPTNADVGVHDVNLTLSDGTNTVEHNFQIIVNNLNDAPTNIALTPATLAKNAPMGTTVGTLSATDADNGDTHTFALFHCGGANDMNFVINDASLISAYNFAGVTTTSQSICVRVTDSASATYDKNITIALTDVTPPSGGGSGGGTTTPPNVPPVITPPVVVTPPTTQSPSEIKIIVTQPTTGGTSGLENKTVIINEIVTGTSSVSVGVSQKDSATNVVNTPVTLSSTTGTQTVVAIKTVATPILTTTGEGVELQTTSVAPNGTSTVSTIKVFNNGTTQTTSVKTTPTGEVITNTIQSLRTDTQTQEDAQGNTQTSFVTGSTTTTCKTTSSGTTVHEVSTLNPLTGVTSTTQAISKVNGSVVTLREDGVVQTNAQLTLSNGDTQVIVVEALANGGSKNIVQFTATDAKVTSTSSRSALAGTQTTIEADGNVNNSVEFDTITTLTSSQKPDGTLSTQLQNKNTGKITQTSSAIAGSSVDIDENANMSTSSLIQKDGFIYKAVALNNANGTTTTRIVKTNATTGVEIQSANTIKPSTPYEAGNSVEINQIDGVIYIKTTAPLDADLVIE